MNEIEKLEALKNDQAFVEKLGQAKNDEEILALLDEQGIHLTAGQLNEARGGNGELDEDALEDVAGGVRVRDITRAGMIGVKIIGQIVTRLPHITPLLPTPGSPRVTR